MNKLNVCYCVYCKKVTETVNINRDIDKIKKTYWGKCAECRNTKLPQSKCFLM